VRTVQVLLGSGCRCPSSQLRAGRLDAKIGTPTVRAAGRPRSVHGGSDGEAARHGGEEGSDAVRELARGVRAYLWATYLAAVVLVGGAGATLVEWDPFAPAHRAL